MRSTLSTTTLEDDTISLCSGESVGFALGFGPLVLDFPECCTSSFSIFEVALEELGALRIWRIFLER